MPYKNEEDRKANSQEYYLKNKDAITRKNKIYREANKEKLAKYSQEYYYTNKDSISVKMKDYSDGRKEEKSAYDKIYRDVNKDSISAYREANKASKSQYNKEYANKNRDRINKNRVLNEAKKKAADPLYKLKCDIRSTVGCSFKRKGWRKNTKTQEILGCDFNILYNHLVLSAIKNYGIYIEGTSYHIDHVIPIATAKTEADVINLNHYTNLQLLTPEDNMKKGSKLNWALNKK